MPDYKTMYFKLFNSVTDAIDTLTEAQKEAEEMYLTSSENEDEKIKKIKIVSPKTDKCTK